MENVSGKLRRIQLKDLEQLCTPRQYIPLSLTSTQQRELCVFSDASNMAIEAVAYLHAVDAQGLCHKGFVMGNNVQRSILTARLFLDTFTTQPRDFMFMSLTEWHVSGSPYTQSSGTSSALSITQQTTYPGPCLWQNTKLVFRYNLSQSH